VRQIVCSLSFLLAVIQVYIFSFTFLVKVLCFWTEICVCLLFKTASLCYSPRSSFCPHINDPHMSNTSVSLVTSWADMHGTTVILMEQTSACFHMCLVCPLNWQHCLACLIKSLDKAVFQHVPVCSALDKDEILYVNLFDHSRKKEEYNHLKLWYLIGRRRVLLSTSTCGSWWRNYLPSCPIYPYNPCSWCAVLLCVTL